MMRRAVRLPFHAEANQRPYGAFPLTKETTPVVIAGT